MTADPTPPVAPTAHELVIDNDTLGWLVAYLEVQWRKEQSKELHDAIEGLSAEQHRRRIQEIRALRPEQPQRPRARERRGPDVGASR